MQLGDLRISMGHRVRIYLSISESRRGLRYSFLQIASQCSLGETKIETWKAIQM